MEIEPLVTEPVLNDTNYVPGYFEGMAAWVLHMVIVIYRSLGPGGFCSLSSTTSPRGPRISLSIASSSSSSMPAYDSSVLSLFIHSFIHSRIYIAPLQENYSEVLPTPARSKRTVFN